MIILTLLIVVLACAGICVLWYCKTRNALNVANLKIEEASSDIDVALEKDMTY